MSSGTTPVTFHRLLAVLASFVMVATACGGDDDSASGAGDDGAAAESTDGGAGTESENGEEAPIDGTIRVATFLDLIGGTTFDPAKSVTISDEEYLSFIYGSLLRREVDGTYTPWFAKSYEIADPKTVKVTLNKGIKFSDGEPYDAEAVAAGMLRTKSGASEEAARGQQQLFQLNLEDIVVDGPLDLTFELNAPVAGQFLAVLSGREAAVPSPAADPATLDTKPVGAGPFLLDDFQPEQYINMIRNPKYFDDGGFRFERLELIHTPAGTQRANALLSGEADLAYDLDVSDLASFEAEPYETIEVTKEFGYNIVQPCPTKPPLDDVRVRRAISLAIDREKLVELTNEGLGEPATALWPSDHAYFNPDLKDAWGYDPEEAKRLMDEAGVDDVDVKIYSTVNFPYEQEVEVMRSQLEEIGVHLELVISQDVLSEFIEAGLPGLMIVPGSRLGVDKYLRYFAPNAAQNVCDQDYTQTIVEPAQEIAGLEPDDPRVVKGMQDLDAYVADEMLAIPLTFVPDVSAYNTERISGEVGTVGNSYRYDLEDAVAEG